MMHFFTCRCCRQRLVRFTQGPDIVIPAGDELEGVRIESCFLKMLRLTQNVFVHVVNK